MFAKTKRPSLDRSASFLARLSLTMTREMNEELLLVMLFLGFFFLLASLTTAGVKREFPSPKAGAEPRVSDVGGSLIEVPRPSSLLMPPSVEYLSLPDSSAMLELLPASVASEKPLKLKVGMARDSIVSRDSFVPAVAAWGVVARGFGFTIGASEG